jgi:hypothetical protein
MIVERKKPHYVVIKKQMWFLLQAKPPLNWQLFQFLSNSSFLLKKKSTNASQQNSTIPGRLPCDHFFKYLMLLLRSYCQRAYFKNNSLFPFFEAKHCLNDIFHMFLIHFMHYYVYMTCQKMSKKSKCFGFVLDFR